MKVVASWSGGKDSCYAAHKAMQGGHRLLSLLNFVSQGGGQTMAHGLHPHLVRAQAEALGLPLVQRETTRHTHEQELKRVVTELKGQGLEGIVFGDIDLVVHRDWLERVCLEMGVTPILPLWGLKPEEIVSGFLDEGFEAIIVCTRADLGPQWLGQRFDRNFLEHLARLGMHPCGESGEYHTLVVDGPLFKHRLEVNGGQPVLRDRYWFWELSRYGGEG